MRHVPLARVALVLAAFACQSTVPVRHVVSIAAPLPTPTAAQPESVPDLCNRVVHMQHARVAHDLADARKSAPDDWKDLSDKEMMAQVDAPLGLGVTCTAFARGAWALEIAQLDLLPGYKSLAAQLEIVAYANGTRVASVTTMHAGYGATFTTANLVLASDYDGDGFPEAYVHESADGIEGGHYDEGRIFTFHGEVEPYAAAFSIEDIGSPRDVDGDGRLDLPTSAGVELGGPVVCMGKSDWVPAGFIAHSLADGTFSTNDAVAKKYALAWCPSAPSKVTSPVEALCARLWATTPAARTVARKLVTSACTPWDCALENTQKPQAKTAKEDCQARVDAFDAAVPFTLP